MKSIKFIKLGCTIFSMRQKYFISFIRAPDETVVQSKFEAKVVESRTSSEVGY